MGLWKVSVQVEDRDPKAFEWAARDLFEETRGKGSWRKAKVAERSEARLLTRVLLASFEKRGWAFAKKK